MARKPKVIEVPGDVAPVEAAPTKQKINVESPEARAILEADYIEINGVNHRILERTSGWIKVDGIGYLSTGA